MIFSLFIDAIYVFVYALTAPFRLAPVVSLPGTWINAVETASDYIASIEPFFPVTTLIVILFIFLAYELAYFTLKMVNWVIRKIPGVS